MDTISDDAHEEIFTSAFKNFEPPVPNKTTKYIILSRTALLFLVNYSVMYMLIITVNISADIHFMPNKKCHKRPVDDSSCRFRHDNVPFARSRSIDDATTRGPSA